MGQKSHQYTILPSRSRMWTDCPSDCSTLEYCRSGSAELGPTSPAPVARPSRCSGDECGNDCDQPDPARGLPSKPSDERRVRWRRWMWAGRAALDVSGCARWWRGRWGAWHRGTAGGGALAAATSGVCVGGAGCEQDVMAALDVSRTSGAGCERMRALAARPIGRLASWNGRWGWSRWRRRLAERFLCRCRGSFWPFQYRSVFFYIRVLRDLHPRSRVRVSGEKVGLRRMEFSIFYVNSVIFIY
jgi:hypothetical protein